MSCASAVSVAVDTRWADFARTKIATWPGTKGLGNTARIEAILCMIQERRSVLEPQRQSHPTVRDD